MKKLLLILLSFNFLNSFSQEIIDLAVYNKTKLVFENTIPIHLKNDKWNIDNYLDILINEQKVNIDSLTLVELVNKSTDKMTKQWQKNDFENVFLVKKGEKLSKKKILSELEIADKREIKTLKRQIRKYNNRPHEWRGYPIFISSPTFSADNQFCIIGFKFGNNGGHTELYKKVNSEWKLIAIFDRYAI